MSTAKEKKKFGDACFKGRSKLVARSQRKKTARKTELILTKLMEMRTDIAKGF